MALLAEADQRAAALEKHGRRDRQEATALRRTLAGFTQVCRSTAVHCASRFRFVGHTRHAATNPGSLSPA